MNKSIYLLFCIFLLFSCSTTKNRINAEDKDLDKLVSMLAGNFSTEKQSKEDSSYLHLRLVMLPIWTEKTDGQWMYVEECAASSKEKPYRQNVYLLKHPSNNVFTTDIYSIKNAMSFTGLQGDTNKLKKLTFDKIDLKVGCTITLNYNDSSYDGSTEGDKCLSDLRGAKYTTTKIRLKEGELIYWDRGFDVMGNQVWGAKLSGYIFLKE